MGRPAALRTGAARRRLSPELDPLPAPAGERPYRRMGPVMVLRGHPPDGGRVLLPLLPQSRTFPPRLPLRWPHLQPLRLPCRNSLARHDERRGLDPARLSLPVARLPQPSAGTQRHVLRHVPRHRLPERPSSDPSLHRRRLDRHLDLPRRQESPPAATNRPRRPVRRSGRRTTNATGLRVRPSRPTLGWRARTHHLESARPVFGPRPLRSSGLQPLRHRLLRREGQFRSLPWSRGALPGPVRHRRALARFPRAPASRPRPRRAPLRLGPQQRLSRRALCPRAATRQGEIAFRRGGALSVRRRRPCRLRHR